MVNIYVGNFGNDVRSEDLMKVFAVFGEVVSATIVKDKFSGESRGFGFVEMPSKKAARDAMDGVREIQGRMVTVNEALPRNDNHRWSKRKVRGGHGSRQGRY